MQNKFPLAWLALLLLVGCSPDSEIVSLKEDRLNARIVALYGSTQALAMPRDGYYANIPQYPKNPITE